MSAKNLGQFEFLATITNTCEIVKKIEDKEIQEELTKAIVGIVAYVNGLETERKGFDRILDELRIEKQRLVLRARKAENPELFKKEQTKWV
jgi:hypothetical protein